MGSRTEHMRELQAALDARPSPSRRAVAQNQHHQDRVQHKKKGQPFAYWLLGLVAVLLIAVDVLLLFVVRASDRPPSDGLVILMIGLFVGGLFLFGLATVIRYVAPKG
jgi:formate/nitrite transporter FocA (FNT family)